MASKEKKAIRGPVDYPRLRELLVKAKGERTYSQYADDAGVDHAVIYKIRKSDDYRPGLSVLQRLASDSAKPEGGVTLTDFLAAAGYPTDNMKLYGSARAMTATLATIGATIPVVGSLVPGVGMVGALGAFATSMALLKRPLTEKEQEKIDPEFAKYVKAQNKFKAMADGIIFSALAEKGITFQPGSMQNIDTFGFRPDKYINILDQKISTWWFKYGFLLPDTGSSPIPYSDQANALMQQVVTAKPDPERKISFIVDDPQTYSLLKQFNSHNSYRGNLSVILIDTENARIQNEALISTYYEEDTTDPLTII